ncbi:MAG TPA: hypothetical protein PK485_07285, partial [Bacteroidales bacterium]|nr:hypothetical protein [Bacteroidales bacterium]
MKKIAALLLALVLCVTVADVPGAYAQIKPLIPRDPAIEKKIDKIISKMTLVEKVGQMTQLEINLLGVDLRAEMMKLMMMPQEQLTTLLKKHGLEKEFDAAAMTKPEKRMEMGFEYYKLYQKI